jgi:multisubunit Na+/H+ antiporter MnhB subunit
MIGVDQVWILFVIYGLGFAAVMLIFALLYRHARRRRAELELDELEVFDTTCEIVRFALLSGVGLVSIAVAAIVPRHQAGLAGFVYFLIGLVEGLHGREAGKRRRQVQARLSAQARPAA